MRVTSDTILNGPIGPTLRRMAMPVGIAVSMNMMFQVVDTYFIGLLGTAELAAVSFTFPVAMMVSSINMGFGVGTAVILGNSIGQGDHAKTSRITTDSLLLAILIAILVTVTGLYSVDVVFGAMGATDTTLPIVHDYMDIWYCGLVMRVLVIFGNAVVRATGDTKTPSMMMITAGAVNVILDPVLIFGLGPVPAMGVKGAAIATVCSWCVPFVVIFVILHCREKLLIYRIPDYREIGQYWLRLCKLSIPVSMSTAFWPAANAVLTVFLARYGEYAVAAFGVGNRFEILLVVVAASLYQSLSVFLAQNLGAGNVRRSRAAIRLSLRFILIFQLGIYLLVLVTSTGLATVFSDDPEVILVTRQFLSIMPLSFTFFAVLQISGSTFNAAQQSHKTLMLHLARSFVFYVPLAWIGMQVFGIPGMFVGASMGSLLGAVLAWKVMNVTYDALERESARNGYKRRPDPRMIGDAVLEPGDN